MEIALPSHITLFGSLLEIEKENIKFRDVLRNRGYEEVWRMWNGFDWAQDEEERKGGVRIWKLTT